MVDVIKQLAAVLILVLAFPLGTLLASRTTEELKEGQKWFKAIFFVSLFMGLFSIFLENEFLVFSFLFIAIISSRSIITK